MIKKAKLTQKYHIRILSIVMILLIMGLCLILKNKSEDEEKVTIRIDVKNVKHKDRLEQYIRKKINLNKIEYIEAAVNWKQFFKLQKEGFDPALQIEIDHKKLIDTYFHTFSEITYLIDSYHRQFPHIVHLEKVGEGSTEHLPIWGIKISDHPDFDENEPAVLFTGTHHAKELLSAEVCIYLIDYLCKNYYQKQEVKYWVDKTEIWIVPVVNPDGHYLVTESNKLLKFWRKNLRDNNSNGIFEPEKDGVDLNRNYDYNWDADSDGDYRSWYYRGSYPFSENETQAVRDLTLREKFVFNLDFHSYGEAILYPWENFKLPPDRDLVINIAKEIAKQIRRRAKLGHYSIRPLNGKLGQCSVWMHGKAGVLSYIVEIGDSHFPEGRDIPGIIEQNVKAAFYVFDRLFRSAIKGIIRNAYSKVPIRAEITILAYTSSVVSNPVSDAVTGFYYRIVEPGIYAIRFSAPGFRTKVIHSIRVESDKVTNLNVELYPIEDILPTEN